MNYNAGSYLKFIMKEFPTPDPRSLIPTRSTNYRTMHGGLGVPSQPLTSKVFSPLRKESANILLLTLICTLLPMITKHQCSFENTTKIRLSKPATMKTSATSLLTIAGNKGLVPCSTWSWNSTFVTHPTTKDFALRTVETSRTLKTSFPPSFLTPPLMRISLGETMIL